MYLGSQGCACTAQNVPAHTQSLLNACYFNSATFQGTPVCMKYIIGSNKLLEKNLLATEACILSQLCHRSVCFLHGVHTTQNKCSSLVMSIYMGQEFVVTVHDLLSFVASETLQDSMDALMSSLCSIETQAWIFIFRQIAEGTAYIHSKSVIHRDLKTDNIVFYQQVKILHPVIIDFGKVQLITTCKTYSQ